jgi:hypothetical protein
MSQPQGKCPGCGGDEPFEQIHAVAGECPDVPDGQCPEWACTSCGAAVIMGALPGAARAQAGSGGQGQDNAGDSDGTQARRSSHAA